ncbi:hypothetical protein [Kitasatospora sp. NBC_01266]|uniref:hypothetical protein n=1 Tax=Kitasatospora sp. NBC_01266 TaxID=2903572 RepID=UPI002E36BAF2|nr:hypothetical protein [Kitasatospora sp. NBC_01266]
MTPYQTQALRKLRELGRQVDAAAERGADTEVLDALLATMRQVHEGIAEHLAEQLGLARRRVCAG